jgi:hypothetical protein
MRFGNMAPFILAFQKFNACYIKRLYVDVVTIETEGFQPSSVTLDWTSTYGSFIFHHGELRLSHNVFVSSNWTQRIRSLMNFITYLEPPYMLELQLHNSSTSNRFFLWLHILMVKVRKNSSHLPPYRNCIHLLKIYIVQNPTFIRYISICSIMNICYSSINNTYPQYGCQMLVMLLMKIKFDITVGFLSTRLRTIPHTRVIRTYCKATIHY